jgi:hypothetical protein
MSLSVRCVVMGSAGRDHMSLNVRCVAMGSRSLRATGVAKHSPSCTAEV